MEKAPDLLAENGKAALILPSKIFLNPTSDAFQRKWLGQVTLETMVQLADFRFILFKEAKCPACVVTFSGQAPPPGHEIEYLTPKVTRTDLRDGMIPVALRDRKWVRLSELRSADREHPLGMLWKARLWGTLRDQKLLDYLFTLPRLSDLVGTPEQMEQGTKRWAKGQGFQPLGRNDRDETPKPVDYSSANHFVTPSLLGDLLYLPQQFAFDITTYFAQRKVDISTLRRAPNERICPPRWCSSIRDSPRPPSSTTR
jgi:hypothetical protein